MPTYCCVPNCTSYGGHKFPSDKETFRKWQVAIKRIDPYSKALWKPTSHSVVCTCHFADSDYTETLLGARKRLKSSAVPCLNPLNNESARQMRRKQRSHKQIIHQHQPTSTSLPDLSVVGAEVEVVPTLDVAESSASISVDTQTECTAVSKSTKSIQTVVTTYQSPLLSISSLRKNPEAIRYYTSLQNYSHFMFVFTVLGPSVNYICTREKLCSEDQFLLTLMKLRQAKDDKELAILFGISNVSASNIFVSWVNFMYFQFQELNIWPSRDVINQYIPEDFKATFPATRVILDGTEIPIQKPTATGPQRETFSSYKNRNTLKVVVGCTPRGSVSYVSEAYGGSCSDRQILERSTLCSDKTMFIRNDSIMADRGIMVQDLFAAQDVKVNTPTMLKGKSQLEPETVVKDRKVASKRIHIERVIGLAKTFKILCREIPGPRITLGNRLIFVCFSLVNFRPSIVSNRA